MGKIIRDHFCPDLVVAPGETIKDYLAENNLTPRLLSKIINLPLDDVTALLAGELPLTDDIANRLAVAIGPPATFWRNHEANYRRGPCRQTHGDGQ